MTEPDAFDPPTVIGYRPVAVPSEVTSWARTAPVVPLHPPRARRSLDVPPAPVEAVASASPAETLIAAAGPLLALVASLSGGVARAEVASLRSAVIDRLSRFEDEALRRGAPATQVQPARYVLCALIDEAVMTTAWGAASDWSTNSLLNRFHGETWGGENVFGLLDKARADPARNLALLILIEHALLLGFEGMYRVRDRGREQLDALREECRHLIGRHLPAPPADLSPEWRGAGIDGALRRYLPLWTVFAAAGCLLVAVYSYHRTRLTFAVAPVVAQMHALDRMLASPGATP